METRMDTGAGRGGTERVLSQALRSGATDFRRPRPAEPLRPAAAAQEEPAAAANATDPEIGERIRDLMKRRDGLLQEIEDVERSYDAAELTVRDLKASL